MKDKILIVGATGLIGTPLMETFSKRAVAVARHKPEWFPYPLVTSDCFDSSFSQIPLHNIKAALLLAFPTDLAKVENFSLPAQKNLVSGFSNLISQLAAQKIPALFFSTDAVLWGLDAQKRVPASPPYPINVYGRLKASCEKILIENGAPGSAILRFVPVGVHPHHSDTAFLGRLLGSALQGIKVTGFDNSWINPVSISQVIRFVENWERGLANASALKIYHLGTKNKITKYDLLFQAAKILNVEAWVQRGTLDLTAGELPRVLDQTLIPSPSCEFNSQEMLNDLLNQIASSLWMQRLASPSATPRPVVY